MRGLKKISLVLLGLALAVSLGWQVAMADSEIGRYQAVVLDPAFVFILDTEKGHVWIWFLGMKPSLRYQGKAVPKFAEKPKPKKLSPKTGSGMTDSLGIFEKEPEKREWVDDLGILTEED